MAPVGVERIYTFMSRKYLVGLQHLRLYGNERVTYDNRSSL